MHGRVVLEAQAVAVRSEPKIPLISGIPELHDEDARQRARPLDPRVPEVTYEAIFALDPVFVDRAMPLVRRP